jgi:hypothetical protein
MKRVYQTIDGREKGNCLVACVASLLEIEINEIPHFITFDDWLGKLSEFMQLKGFRSIGSLYNLEESKIRNSKAHNDWYIENKDFANNIDRLQHYTGINGLFMATVYSPNYYDKSECHPALHGVLIDKEFKIVHDPQIKYKDVRQYPRSDDLGYNGIIDIDLFEK